MYLMKTLYALFIIYKEPLSVMCMYSHFFFWIEQKRAKTPAILFFGVCHFPCPEDPKASERKSLQIGENSSQTFGTGTKQEYFLPHFVLMTTINIYIFHCFLSL